MYWKRKKLNYDILISPIDKPFAEFDQNEANYYFQWYISHIKERVKYLSDYSGIVLDYSVDSLVFIWRWFLEIAEIEKTPAKGMKELRKDLKSFPKEITHAVLSERGKQFSLQTEYIIRDIAMYFGQLYVENNRSISWGYHTDTNKDSFANMPLLIGFEDREFDPPFKVEFEPCFIVREIACNIFDNEQNAEDLKNMYLNWQRMVFSV